MHAYWQFVRRHAAALGFGFLCVFWGNFGQSFFLGWYGNAILQDLALSAKTYGLIYSLATLASALTVVWVGGLIDQWPLRAYLVMVTVGLFGASLVMAFASNVVMLALGFYGLRLFGQALLPHTGITSMARWFAADRGKAMSIAGSGVPLGEVVLPGLAVLLLSWWSWQVGWWLISASVIAIFLPLALLCLGRSTTELRQEAPKHAPMKPAAGRRLLLGDLRFWCALPTLLATPFVLTAVFIHQGFLLSEKLWPEPLMAQAFMVLGVGHWAASLLCGVLVDRFSGRALFRLYLLPLIAALLLLANGEGAWVAFAVMLLFALSIGASSTVVNAMWAEVYGTPYLGAIRAALSGLMVFATALSPWLVGFAIDQDVSLSSLSNGSALVLVAALGLLRWSYRPR